MLTTLKFARFAGGVAFLSGVPKSVEAVPATAAQSVLRTELEDVGGW